MSTAEDGTTTVEFGDGKCGRRLPAGAERISALYRTGAGSAENVPEKKDRCGGRHRDIVFLDIWAVKVTAIEDAHLCEPALGGPDTSNRGQ